MNRSVTDILSKDHLRELRDNGWVVIHREPTSAMTKAFYGGKFPEEVAFTDAFHRVVAASINEQNRKSE